VLYDVAPDVLEVRGAYRRLGAVSPAWWVAVLATSAAGIWCMCALQRMALNDAEWFPVVTSQLARRECSDAPEARFGVRS
jgi:hypothetical protein